MVEQHYSHSLHGSHGGADASLKFFANGNIEIEFHQRGGQAIHYRLTGKHDPKSDNYGWLRIQRVEDLSKSPPEIIPIEELGWEHIYEYAKVARCELLLHPEDALWVNGRWNEYFDLILFTNYFVQEGYDGLKYLIESGELKDAEPPEWVALITDSFMKHLEHLVIGLDKMKFTRIDGEESVRPHKTLTAY